jgi:hypothetical protein
MRRHVFFRVRVGYGISMCLTVGRDEEEEMRKSER